MKNEGILRAAELFREKIELAQNSNDRSQDILKAIRGFLEDIGSNIANGDNTLANAQQEILPGVEQLIVKAGSNKS